MSSEIVPVSVLKKRKTSTKACIDAYETPNPQVESGFSRRSRKIQRGSSQIEITPEFVLDDFQAEQPSIKALAKIPPRSMSTTDQASPSKQKKGYVSRVSPREISVSKPRSEKGRRNYKKLFNDIENIQDATFTEDFDEKTPAMSAISASKVKSLAAGKKDESASMKAISAKKAQTKSQLAKVEKSPQFVSDGFRVETSAVKTKTVNDRWLIDKAADELYHTVKVIGKATGKVAKATGKAVKAGLHEFNELSEIAVQNPLLVQIGKVHTQNMEGIAAGARRARGSILAAGNNSRKRHMTAGSLITTHSPGTNTGTTTTVPNQRVFTHVVHRKGGDIIRYFDARGLEISATQAKRLIKDAPLININDESYNQNIRGVVNPIGTAHNPLRTQRRHGNPIGEITRATHPSGLVRRAKNPVGIIHGAVQSAYKPIGAVNTATTATTATNVMKNPTGFVHRNPVVDSSAVTPSRLLYRHAGA